MQLKMQNGVQVSSEITEFFVDKSIFITGATGFLGKVLVEKLLRSCNDVNKIYLLVRTKRGKSTDERMDTLTDSKLFEKVKNLHPDYKKKLVGINGDIREPNLGISPEDRQLLIQNVDIVYHSAATVRFDEPMKVAVDMNIIAVRKIIELCKQMKNLKSFVHISTAYSNCDLENINEKIYDSPVKADEIIKTCEWMEDDVINSITPKLLKSKPNTYTYTKQIAESMILEECKDLPVSIIRPSIIGATWREPFSGWAENLNGPTALFPAIGMGALRIMMAEHTATCDLIPVDVTVNLMIAVAWFTARKNNKQITVFNNTSGQINNFTWGDFELYGRSVFRENPYKNAFMMPDPRFTSSTFFCSFIRIVEQYIPAYAMDLIQKISLKKTKFVMMQDKMSKKLKMIEFFSLNSWNWSNDNIFMLKDQLSETDRQAFNFDVTELDWRKYIEKYCTGVKEYLMKEEMCNKIVSKRIEKMKRKQNMILWGLFFFLVSIIWKIFF